MQLAALPWFGLRELPCRCRCSDRNVRVSERAAPCAQYRWLRRRRRWPSTSTRRSRLSSRWPEWERSAPSNSRWSACVRAERGRRYRLPPSKPRCSRTEDVEGSVAGRWKRWRRVEVRRANSRFLSERNNYRI